MISSALPDLEEESWWSGGSGMLPRGSFQFCHVGWELKPAGLLLVGLVVEYVEGLNTSSEPRESFVNGGIRVVGLSDSSSISEAKLSDLLKYIRAWFFT